MSHISQPLNLRAHLRETDLRLELVPFLDMAVIALCFLLLDSPYISAPGILIELPDAQHLNAAHTITKITILTVKNNDLLLYNGRVIALDEFHKIALEEKGTHRNETLLVKPSKDVSLQSLVDIFDAARSAGFKQVHIAAEPK